MINLGISLFDLGYLELKKEHRKDKRVKISMKGILDRAIKIRKFLDEKERNKSLKRNKLGKFI
jgi:hypothetical protein